MNKLHEDPHRKLVGARASLAQSQGSGVLEILVSPNKKLIWSGGPAAPSDKHQDVQRHFSLGVLFRLGPYPKAPRWLHL